MVRRSAGVVGLVAVLGLSPGHAQMRLEGLDRVYFTRVASGDRTVRTEPSTADEQTAVERRAAASQAPSHLPLILEKPDHLSPQEIVVPSEEEVPDLVFLVRDFLLPTQEAGSPSWIREILDTTHPRICEVWWALYDGGHRSDIWRFSPTAGDPDGKMLSNYRLESISAPDSGQIVFRVRGEMERPGGAWWILGKEFRFDLRSRALLLTRVCNSFGFFHAYDFQDTTGVVSVRTEQELAGQFVTREVDILLDQTPPGCRLPEALVTGEGEFAWRDLEEAARCVTDLDGAKVTYRDLDSRSFAERETPAPPPETR